MKKLFSLLMVLSLILTVSSCSKDNDDPNMPASVTDTHTYEITFMIGGGQPTSSPVEMKLSDFKAIGTYTKNVHKGDLIPADASLTITGITAGSHELQNVKLSLDGTKTVLDLGTLAQDKTATTTQDINFLQQVVNRLVSNKSATVTFSTTKSLKDVSRTIPIKIKIKAIYHLK